MLLRYLFVHSVSNIQSGGYRRCRARRPMRGRCCRVCGDPSRPQGHADGRASATAACRSRMSGPKGADATKRNRIRSNRRRGIPRRAVANLCAY